MANRWLILPQCGNIFPSFQPELGLYLYQTHNVELISTKGCLKSFRSRREDLWPVEVDFHKFPWVYSNLPILGAAADLFSLRVKTPDLLAGEALSRVHRVSESDVGRISGNGG
jgi:hypothetical protein